MDNITCDTNISNYINTERLFKSIKFNIGQIVYLVTDEEQLNRIVNGINITPNGIIYRLSCGIIDSFHFDIEISNTKKY